MTIAKTNKLGQYIPGPGVPPLKDYGFDDNNNLVNNNTPGFDVFQWIQDYWYIPVIFLGAIILFKK